MVNPPPLCIQNPTVTGGSHGARASCAEGAASQHPQSVSVQPAAGENFEDFQLLKTPDAISQ